MVTPSNTADVSTILNVLTSASQGQNPAHRSANESENPTCPFAIRSGGHAYNTAFNNISPGITIDLSNLNTITLSPDNKTVSVGPAATWGAVYDILDPLNLSVPGGRAGQVGVGGLTLGGGISYFSPRVGWTCDSVSEFEIVLADGEVVTASEGDNADLWISLCGGGAASFGVVARIDIKTFPQGKIWGGFVYHAPDTVPGQLDAFEGFSAAESYDEYASLIMSFAFSDGVGGAVVNSIVYTKEVEEEYPAVYAPFFELPSLSRNVKISALGEIAREQGSFSSDGRRYVSLLYPSPAPFLVSSTLYQELCVCRRRY
jgi:FAD/FMN-containing dehydrogenase